MISGVSGYTVQQPKGQSVAQAAGQYTQDQQGKLQTLYQQGVSRLGQIQVGGQSQVAGSGHQGGLGGSGGTQQMYNQKTGAGAGLTTQTGRMQHLAGVQVLQTQPVLAQAGAPGGFGATAVQVVQPKTSTHAAGGVQIAVSLRSAT